LSVEIKGHPIRWFLPRLLFITLTFWIGNAIENMIVSYNPSFEYNPIPRSILLVMNIAAMFLFTHISMKYLKLHGNWKAIEVVAINFLSLWIVPNILKGIFRDWTIGWWCAELLLFFGLLCGPLVLGVLYLESMVKEDESRQKASFYADLLVHDITNYHQAILLSLGLLEMDMHDENILQQALNESAYSLQRAEQLVRSVKHLGMLEKSETSNIFPIDLVYCINEAFRQSLPIIDMEYVEIYCPYEEGKYYAKANNLLIDAFINLIRNAVQYSPERKRIEFRINQESHNNQIYWIIEVMDYGRGIESKQKALLFQNYSGDRSVPRPSLSFVQTIIDSYGGTITVRDRIEGNYTKGSNFVIKIPASSKGRIQ
jgi:signal transduction histidine kinase